MAWFMDHKLNISMVVLRQSYGILAQDGKDTSSSIHFLKQNFLTVHSSFLLKVGTPMNKAINRKISQLFEGGIVKKLEAERIEAINKANREKTQTPSAPEAQILTLEHLGLSFFAILICLGLCTVVFAVECVVGFVQKKLNHR
jgi:hypothetical protein